MDLNFENRVVAADDVMFRELDGEAVLLNLENEAYYGLDDIGTRIWQVVTTSPSLHAAMEILLSEYEVQPKQLKSDINTLLSDLMQNGLVRVEDANVV